MSREVRIGALSTVGAIVAVAFANVIENDPGEEGDVAGFLILSAVSVLAAYLVFRVVVPRAKGAPPEDNAPAKRDLVVSIVGFLAVAAFWSGLPYVLGAGGALLGRIGQERGATARGKGLATGALVIGVLAIVLAAAVAVGDELG